MATIDVDKYLEPISDEAPCGENLEYDAGYTELERLAQGKPERQAGDEIIPAEDPRWQDVRTAAEELMDRTRDLRVVVYLTHASVNLEGLPGLASGLKLIHGLLQNFWDDVYPQLDKDDDDDPTFRVNSLVALNARDGFVRSVLRAPLVDSRAAGRFSLRDVRVAGGEVSSGDGEEAPDGALIDAAFMDGDLDELTATADAAKEARAALELIDALLREKVGTEHVPEFDLIGAELRSIQSLLGEQLARRGVDDESGAAESGGETARARSAEGGIGQINTREDVVRVLDKVTEYFRKHEPSSPVPLLLQRAKRLVAKDFMEILRDMAPEGVSQAELIGGLEQDD